VSSSRGTAGADVGCAEKQIPLQVAGDTIRSPVLFIEFIIRWMMDAYDLLNTGDSPISKHSLATNQIYSKHFISSHT